MVLLQFRLRDRIEVILVIPLPCLCGAGKEKRTVDRGDLDILEILRTLFPAAYIPEAMIFKCKFDQAFAFIALDPFLAIFLEFRHLDVGTGAEDIDRIVGGHSECGVIRASGSIECSLGEIEIEFTETEDYPGVTAAGLVVGGGHAGSVDVLLEIVARRCRTIFRRSIEPAGKGFDNLLL